MIIITNIKILLLRLSFFLIKFAILKNEIILKAKRDLTKGSILGNLLSVSLPTMIAFTSHTVNDLVDMIWIGRISAEAVAAVTIFTTVFWVIVLLNNIIGTSSISLISQSFGAKEFERTQEVIEQTLSFKFIVAVAASIFMLLFMEPLFKMFTESTSVYQYTLDYGYIRVFFLPIMFSTFSVSTSLICIGDSKRQMYIMVGSSLLNIILDPIFIFDKIPYLNVDGLGYGVYGAALATVISFTVAFIVGFWILLSGKSFVKISLKGLFKLNWEIDKKLWTIGLPSGLENFTRSFGQLISLKMIAGYGTTALAVMGISNRLLGIAIIPIFGLLRGGSTVVGQNLGAENVDRAEKTAYIAGYFGAIIMGGLSIVAFIFADPIMQLFVNDREVVKSGITMIRIMFPGYITVGFLLGLACVFPGSGHNKPLLISGFISKTFVQIPLLVLFVYYFNFPLEHIWWTYISAEVLEFFIILYYFREGTWKNIRV